MPPQPPSPVIASSSTLWATASKEWVIPAKPKPGRKPKKDLALASVQQNDVSDANGRRVQNRAAQRAFRERKQSQLAELQARIQLYEQGEIERNVALQTVAKRLKDENDHLRAENARLKQTIANYERDRLAPKPDENKRWRDSPSDGPDDQNLPKKRSKLDAIKTTPSFRVPTPTAMALASPQVSSPSSENGPSSLPTPAQGDVIFPPAVSTLESIFNFHSGSKAPVFNGIDSMETFECGLCVDGTSCVCHEMALNLPTPFKTETAEPATSLVPVALPPASQIGAQSILDNLPPYQPPVPLRRRPDVRPLRSLFPVVPLSENLSRVTPTSQANCSGDPSNCLACADDVFGQAFCAAVGESLAAGGPCADCPRGIKDADGARPNPSREGGNTAEIIPTSDAWRQLKSHPNVSFADLTLLAEVVARRSKCTGPTVVISPPPGSVTLERPASSVASNDRPATVAAVDDDVILLSGPHARYHMKKRERSACPSPNLAPNEKLVACLQPRSVREVHASGVREAMALLDSRF
ncbi:hypothetical protein BC827DRAFT_1120965 [Russula dissimulans]|nr:hypothetical protein BC827DRAFT_1120965 [Russula dissimulans]